MKQFAVELKRTSYVTIYVEAINEDEAENKAWEELAAGESYGIGGDCDWNLSDISEQPTQEVTV